MGPPARQLWDHPESGAAEGCRWLVQRSARNAGRPKLRISVTDILIKSGGVTEHENAADAQ